MTVCYRWRGGSEHLLRHGAGSPVTLLILPALFEEANRMRRFTVAMMRGLANHGIGTVLPDLPGTGESLLDLAEVSLDDWHDAFAAVAETVGKPMQTVAIRGGALLDGGADRGWRLAPETGERLLRDMVRATALSGATTAAAVDQQARAQPTALAGNTLNPELYMALAVAVPATGSYRAVEIGSASDGSAVQLNGAKLWRTAEPGDDPELVAAVVADIARWTTTCANN